MNSESTQSVTAATAFESGVKPPHSKIGNVRFQKALARIPQRTPPIWLMRQAGRYHRHYQALRAKHSFVDLCKQPELAADVALGPVMDFGFDAVMNKIGYPDHWRDYSSVNIGRTSYLQNQQNAVHFEFERWVHKIGNPVDRTEWGMTPR